MDTKSVNVFRAKLIPLSSLTQKSSSSSSSSLSSSHCRRRRPHEKRGGGGGGPMTAMGNSLPPIAKMESEKNGRHLCAMEEMNMSNLLSQKQILGPPSSSSSSSSSSREEDYLRRIPFPIQDSSHAEGNKFNDRESPEFSMLRTYLWNNQSLPGRGGHDDDDLSPPKLKFLPQHYIVIENPDSLLFRQVLARLNQDGGILSCGFQGQFLGRHGKLGLISIVDSGKNSDILYVFDVIKGGNPMMTAGLLDILRNPSICKIMHDTRQISDYLKGFYNAELRNVYDTLAAHLSFVSWAVYGSRASINNFTLNHCIKGYLGVQTLHLFFPHYRLHYLQQDTEIWIKRPLNEDCLLGAVRNVMYLRDLREMTTKALMIPFIRTTRALQRVIRDASDQEAKQLQYETHQIQPDVLEVLPDWRRRPIHSRLGILDSQQPDQIHNSVGQLDPKLIFSKDTMHMNNFNNYLKETKS